MHETARVRVSHTLVHHIGGATRNYVYKKWIIANVIHKHSIECATAHSVYYALSSHGKVPVTRNKFVYACIFNKSTKVQNARR